MYELISELQIKKYYVEKKIKRKIKRKTNLWDPKTSTTLCSTRDKEYTSSFSQVVEVDYSKDMMSKLGVVY